MKTMEFESDSTSTKMDMIKSSEKIVKDFSIEEVCSITMSTHAVSINAERTNVQIENALTNCIGTSEAIESEQRSRISPNLFPNNQIEIVKADDVDKRWVSEMPAVSKGLKMIGSLGLLNQYASSSDELDGTEDEDSKNDMTEIPQNSEKIKSKSDTLSKSILDNAISHGSYRGVNVDTSDSDADDSDIEYVNDIHMQTIDITNDEDLKQFLENCENSKPQGPIRAKGELRVEDLPPIEELSITVAESDCVQLGTLHSIVDALVLVESLPNFAALDIDTVLFLESGNRTLGQVFDVMGNVASPMYCVRFNCVDDIKRKDLTIGMKVYVAPQTEYTNFIVLSDLMKRKGCDASWENDNEVPVDFNEFSDDEEERSARRKKAQKQRNRKRISESDAQLPDKIQIKNEPSTSHRKILPRNYRTFNNGAKFYKDNQGYSNRCADYNQHKVSPIETKHCWHTAAMHNIIPLQTGNPVLLQQGYHPNPTSNYYPNPYNLQMSYNQLNQQAFPPLPPPMPYTNPKKL